MNLAQVNRVFQRSECIDRQGGYSEGIFCTKTYAVHSHQKWLAKVMQPTFWCKNDIHLRIKITKIIQNYLQQVIYDLKWHHSWAVKVFDYGTGRLWIWAWLRPCTEKKSVLPSNDWVPFERQLKTMKGEDWYPSSIFCAKDTHHPKDSQACKSLHADKEDSDQTAQMWSLIWVFVGCTSEDTFSHCSSYGLLTHCRLNELPHTIYWKILISILGMSGYVI